MNLKAVVPVVLIGVSSVLTSTQAPKQKTVDKNVKKIEIKKTDPIRLIENTYFVGMSDEDKIVNHNRLLNAYGKTEGNYIVVDKQNCEAKVYTPDGHVIYRAEVALGKEIGDKRSGGYGVKGVEFHPYTTPGEFVIDSEGSPEGSDDDRLYGERAMSIAGDHTLAEYANQETLALHRVPKTPMGKLRENVFYNGTIEDNRVSYGCVNFMPDDYDEMRSCIDGIGTKVYILPEEEGNYLHIEKQKDGTYKFFQTKYRYESQENE